MNGATSKSFTLSRSKSRSFELLLNRNEFTTKYIGCCQVEDSARGNYADIDRTVEELLSSFSKLDFQNLGRCTLTVDVDNVIMALDKGSRKITLPLATVLYYKADVKHDKVFAFICKKILTPSVQRHGQKNTLLKKEILICHAFLCNKKTQAERIAYRFLQATTQNYCKRSPLQCPSISSEKSSGDDETADLLKS